MQKAKAFFLTTEAGKVVPNKKRLFAAAGSAVTFGIVAMFFVDEPDTSYLGKTDRPLSSDIKNKGQPKDPNAPPGTVDKLLHSSGQTAPANQPKRPGGQGLKITYKAQQVLLSGNAGDPMKTMPIGTNLIGKTLTTIDTREAEQLVKVLLPYGGRAGAGGELPKNTIIFGQVTYGGKGEKVFLKFSKGVLPSGREFQLEAQALSSSDYAPGLVGRFHGNADMRVASSLGLTMVAGMSDVLTEKESLGGGGLMPGAVAPKANMRNALFHGVSGVAQAEANLQAEAIGQEPEYVTIDAGADLIVSLSKAYVEN